MTPLETIVEKAVRGELLLLAGNDLPSAVTGIPSGQELAHALAHHFSRTVEPSLAATAARLNPAEFAPFVRQQIATADSGDPAPFYKALAALPVPFVMSAAFDTRLAQALADAGKKFNLLIDNDDLNTRTFNRPDLIKVCGDISRPLSLIISSKQYETLLNRPERKTIFNNWINEWLKSKTVLLVGCNPAATPGTRSDFFHLYNHVLRFRSAFQKEAFLVWANPANHEFWTNPARNVTLIDQNPVAFLDQFASAMVGRAVSLPADSELESLKRLAQVLAGSTSAAELREAEAEVNAAHRVRLIRATLRLKLGQENEASEEAPTLRARLDMEYFPDILNLPAEEFRDTGITLDELVEWAEDAAVRRTKMQPFEHSAVEETALDFLEKIVPENSQAREAFEQALFLDKTFADQFVVVLEIDDQRGRLSPIPWELLHAGKINRPGIVSGRGFLGRSYPVYRRLPGAASPQRVEARIRRLLIVAADPTDKLTTQLLDEIEFLREIFPQSVHVDIIGPGDPRVSQPEQIKSMLRDGDYQAFHFTGHGLFDEFQPEQSKLLLGRPGDHQTAQLTAGELGDIALQSPLTFVCLSACQVGESAEEADQERPWEEVGIADALINNGVPAVLGMRWNVGVDSALKMIKRFYTELLKGKSLEQSLFLARGDVDIAKPDWVNPILIKRHGVLDQGL